MGGHARRRGTDDEGIKMCSTCCLLLLYGLSVAGRRFVIDEESAALLLAAVAAVEREERVAAAGDGVAHESNAGRVVGWVEVEPHPRGHRPLTVVDDEVVAADVEGR